MMTITANIILVESLILLFSKRFLNVSKIRIFLVRERLGIYWGLLISNMINFILPWRFVMTEGAKDFVSKVDLGTQQLALLILTVLIAYSFI